MFRPRYWVVAVDPCGQIEKSEFTAAEILRNTGAGHVTKFFENIEFLMELKIENFASGYRARALPYIFSGRAGGRSLRVRVPYAIRRAVLPKSNTLTGVIGRRHG